MRLGEDILTAQQVGDLLGIESRHVRALAEAGSIARVARGIYDRTSVERYRAERGAGRTRTWAETTAWAAMGMLANVTPISVGTVQASRLRATLRTLASPSDLVLRLRDRATVTTWSGHRAVLDRLPGHMVMPGREKLGLVADDTVVDGYLPSNRLAQIVRDNRLREDSRGWVTLRCTDVDISYVQHLAQTSTTLAAVDAATSLDPRERGVGERELDRQVQAFRAHVRS